MSLVELILKYVGVTFGYETSERSYYISGRENLEKLHSIGISELHSTNHAKFVAMLDSYKQYHYKRNPLSPVVLNALSSPMTTQDVANYIGRSRARASRLLTELRRQNEIEMYKVRSTYYWIRSDEEIIVISSQKSKILDALRLRDDYSNSRRH